MKVKATTSGVVRQMRELSNSQVSDAQVQRVLRARVKRLHDQEDEERERVVSLVAQTVARRNMHLKEDIFEELLRQMLFGAGSEVFELYAIFFSSQLKNGYRLAGRGLLTGLRFEIKARYQELGGCARKWRLRQYLRQLNSRSKERVRAQQDLDELRLLEIADLRARVLQRCG